jgi:hypothetical protein
MQVLQGRDPLPKQEVATTQLASCIRNHVCRCNEMPPRQTAQMPPYPLRTASERHLDQPARGLSHRYACFNQPAAECCSFYAFVSRRLRRAATLITSGYPACRIFAVSRPGRFMLQISPIHASRSYQGQSGSPFDVTIWSFADQTCFSRSSESSRDGSFFICRTSASCLPSRLPRPLALAFPPDFRSPDNAVSDRLVLRLRS